MKKIIIIISIIGITGCSSNTIKNSEMSDASKTFTIMPATDPALDAQALAIKNQEIIEEKTKEVLNFCQPRLSGFEKETKSQATKAYWLSMSGLIAGAVLSPALIAANAEANAAWIAASSGWAGATNFAGDSLKTSGLSGSSIAKTRNDIINKVMEKIEIAGNGTKTFNERRNALMKARAACILYAIAVPTIQSN